MQHCKEWLALPTKLVAVDLNGKDDEISQEVPNLKRNLQLRLDSPLKSAPQQ